MKLLKFSNTKPPRESGIYFLYSKNKNLMYIGRAKNLYLRLRDHFSPNKDRTGNLAGVDYSYYCFMLADRDKLELLEKKLIINLKPLFNIEHAVIIQKRVRDYRRRFRFPEDVGKDFDEFKKAVCRIWESEIK